MRFYIKSYTQRWRLVSNDKKNEKAQDLPEVEIIVSKKYKNTPNEVVYNSKTNKLYYELKVKGLTGYIATDDAIDELRIIIEHYHGIMKSTNKILDKDTSDILKSHFKLWLREKLDAGEINKRESNA